MKRPASMPARQHEHFRDVEGLEDIVESAHLGCLDGRFGGPEGGHDDHRDQRLDPADRLEGFEPVHSGKPDVHDDQVELVRAHKGQRRLAARGGAHRMLFLAQQLVEALPQVVIVIDYQDRSQAASFRHGRVMVNVVPLFCRDFILRTPLWSSTMRATILSPKPGPLLFCRKEGLEYPFRMPTGTPGPLSTYLDDGYAPYRFGVPSSRL